MSGSAQLANNFIKHVKITQVRLVQLGVRRPLLAIDYYPCITLTQPKGWSVLPCSRGFVEDACIDLE